MTFNIRCDMGRDGADNWCHRCDLVYRTIREQQADLVGLQEVLPSQRQGVEENLPEFRWLGRGRDFAGGGEQCAVGVSPELEILDQGTFWLSQTPQQESSLGWDACLPRICTWARLRKGKVEFLFGNTHFDHLGETARLESARLLGQQLTAGGVPSILLGDFNSQPASPPLRVLEQFWWDVHEGSTETTYQEFGRIPDGPKIDYIMASPGFRTVEAQVLSQEQGPYPSDHFPLVARLATKLAPNEEDRVL